jgi:glycosyltransferase involved in cell wall biosynthesis
LPKGPAGGSARVPIARLSVDGVAFGLSPAGGLISYWAALLETLSSRPIEIELSLPDRLRAQPPPISPPCSSVATRSAFVSTYYTLPPDPGLLSVVVVHDLIYETDPGVAAVLGDAADLLERKQACLRAASAVICPSAATAALLTDQYPWAPEPVVIPHGVSMDFVPTVGDAPPVAGPTVRPYLLYVGGRQGYKNFGLAIEVAKRLATQVPGLRLMVVGSEAEPSSDERAATAATASVDALFRGVVERTKLVELYRGAYAVICPSRMEGFGLVPVEAASCGAPTVCSDIPAHRETLGGLVAMFDPDDVAGALRAIERERALSVGERIARASVVSQRFRWETAADRFCQVVDGVANG